MPGMRAASAFGPMTCKAPSNNSRRTCDDVCRVRVLLLLDRAELCAQLSVCPQACPTTHRNQLECCRRVGCMRARDSSSCYLQVVLCLESLVASCVVPVVVCVEYVVQFPTPAGQCCSSVRWSPCSAWQAVPSKVVCASLCATMLSRQDPRVHSDCFVVPHTVSCMLQHSCKHPALLLPPVTTRSDSRLTAPAALC